MIKLAAISRSFAAGVVATACLAATGAYADTTITIVNNLNQALEANAVGPAFQKFGGIKRVKGPPDKILAHSRGTFKVKKSGGDPGFSITYTVAAPPGPHLLGSRQIILYYNDNAHKGCGSQNLSTNPKEDPIVTVKSCGDFKSKDWTYTIAPGK